MDVDQVAAVVVDAHALVVRAAAVRVAQLRLIGRDDVQVDVVGLLITADLDLDGLSDAQIGTEPVVDIAFDLTGAGRAASGLIDRAGEQHRGVERLGRGGLIVGASPRLVAVVEIPVDRKLARQTD